MTKFGVNEQLITKSENHIKIKRPKVALTGLVILY